jgi:hypothetical protein
LPRPAPTISLDVVTPSWTQRATAWLCLALALVIALLPAGGVMTCLGSDGHVGLGAATEVSACPCAHDAVAATDDPVGLPSTERHPPCDDLALDLPDACRDSESQQAFAVAFDEVAAVAPTWSPAGTRVDCGATLAPSPPGTALLPRQFLAHRRAVVLLI